MSENFIFNDDFLLSSDESSDEEEPNDDFLLSSNESSDEEEPTVKKNAKAIAKVSDQVLLFKSKSHRNAYRIQLLQKRAEKAEKENWELKKRLDEFMDRMQSMEDSVRAVNISIKSGWKAFEKNWDGEMENGVDQQPKKKRPRNE